MTEDVQRKLFERWLLDSYVDKSFHETRGPYWVGRSEKYPDEYAHREFQLYWEIWRDAIKYNEENMKQLRPFDETLSAFSAIKKDFFNKPFIVKKVGNEYAVQDTREDWTTVAAFWGKLDNSYNYAIEFMNKLNEIESKKEKAK